LFESGFRLLTESGKLPSGYGVTLDELDGNIFDEQEEIKTEMPFQLHFPAKFGNLKQNYGHKDCM